MSVRLARGTSALDLVSYLRAADEQGARRRDVLAVLTERYALPFEDARLAMDRVSGGAVRAATGNPANVPDKAKDPLAWISYRLELGLSVEEEAVVEPSPGQRAAAEALVAGAKRGEPARGTGDVAVALEVARLAVASREPDQTRFHLLIEAATSFADEDPFDEYVIALEYLLAAVELTIEVRGASTELDALRDRTERVLARASTD